VARAQAAEGFSLAGGLETALAEYHDTNGVFPDGTTDAHTAIGIEPAGNIVGKYVTGVVVSNDGEGTITATFGSGNHAGKFLRLTPTATDGAVFFDCTTDIDEPYRPSGCEEGDGDGDGDGDKVAWEPKGNYRQTWPDNPACWDPSFPPSGGWVEGNSVTFENYIDSVSIGNHSMLNLNSQRPNDAMLPNQLADKGQALPDCDPAPATPYASNCYSIFRGYFTYMHHSYNEGVWARRFVEYTYGTAGNQFLCAS